MSGWIKLYKELPDSYTWKSLNRRQRSLLIEVLLLAEFTPKIHTCLHCAKRVNIPAGGFIKSYPQLARIFEIPGSTARTLMVRLSDLDFLTITSTRCHTLFSIKNWGLFQAGQNHPDRCADHGTTSGTDWHSDDPQIDSIIRSKKEEGVSTRKKTELNLDDFPEEVAIATNWMDQLPFYNNSSIRAQSMRGWVNAIEKLHRIDKHSYQDIKDLIALIIDDTGDGSWGGWFTNCQSPMKLRKKNKDGIPYFDYIRSKLQSQTPQRPIIWADPTS